MSVLIRMKMPKCCDMCWALDDYGDYPRCRITQEQRGYNFPVRDKRMDNCPLIELPPHGRLIDADALMKKGMPLSFSVQRWVQEVDIACAPTIIEAEVSE